MLRGASVIHKITDEPGEETTDVWVDMTVAAEYRLSDSADAAVEADKIAFGTQLQLLAEGEKFWKCKYGDKIVYIESKYLTKNNGSVVYDDKDDEIVITGANGGQLRTYADAYDDQNRYGSPLPKGTKLKRTGLSKNGNWSRVEYEGKTFYIYKSVYGELS